MRKANWKRYKTWVDYFSPDGLPGNPPPYNEEGEPDIPEEEYNPEEEDERFNVTREEEE
jgi:hypothetical protein